jgi:hypothetical protein
MKKPSGARFNHRPGNFADVGFEASAADAAQGPSVTLDQEFGAWSAIGRAGNVDHRGENGMLSKLSQTNDACAKLGRFAPMFHWKLCGLLYIARPKQVSM